ncbi:MAG: AsmA family protein [Alphaproteobacteria bacterium]
MRKILIGVAAVIAVLIATALVVPSFIDWNAHKGRIEAEAEAATGRKLTIAGDVGLAVLPSPRLRAREVRFANAPGAAVPDMVTLKALDVDVAFWPLLTGTIRVTRVTLVEPVIELQPLADGRGNWELGAMAPTPTPVSAGAVAPAQTAGGSALAIRLDDVRIENGTVVWRDGSRVVQRIEKIDLRASAGSLQGPFQLDGSLSVRGAPATIEATVGRLAPDAGVPFKATVGLKAAKAQAILVATLGPEGPARKVDGTLRVEAESIAGAIAAVTGNSGGAPAAPLTLEAKFAAAGQRLTVEPFSIALGDTAMTGSIVAGPDRAGRTSVAATLRAPRLDIDRWLAADAAPPPKAGAAPPAGGAPAAPGPAVAGFSLPTGVDVRVDVQAEAVIARGQTVRNAALVARLADGKLTIERAAAQLPGPTDVVLAGTIQPVQGKAVVDGRLQANAQSLRTLLAAYGALPEGMPPQKLGRASLQTRIKGDAGQIEIQELALALDGMKASGAATVRPGARPAIGARLVVDRLDLDSYAPSPPPAGSRPASAPAAAAAAKPARAFDPGIDLNLDARVGLLTAGGHTARDVAIAGTLQGGTLALRQASVADYAGATAKVAGTVRDLGPAASVDLTIEASGRDLGRLLSQGGAAAPAQAQQPFQLAGSLKGDAGKLAVDLTAKLADGQAKVAGTVEPAKGPQGVALAVDVSHPSTGRLLGQLSPGYRAQGGDIGPFRLVARTRADGPTLFLDGFSLQAGAARIEGPVRIETAGKRPKVVADLTGTEIALDPFLPVQQRASIAPPTAPYGRPGVVPVQARRPAPEPAQARPPASAERWSRQSLDLSALLATDADVKLRAASYRQGRWVVTKPDVALTLSDGTLTLSRFTGQVYGGDVTMTASLVGRGTPTVKLDLSAKDVNVGQAVDTGRVIRLVGGRAKATLAVQAAGRSVHDLVNALGGTGSLDVRDGTLRGLNLGAAVRALTANDPTKLPNLLTLAQDLGKDGDTPFSSLTGTFRIERGVVRSEDLKMVAAGFTASGVTATSLPVWTTQTRIEALIATQPNPVPLGIRIEGPIDEPKKVFETNALQAYLAERFGARGLQQLLPGTGQGQQSPGQQSPGQQPQQRRSNPLELLNPLLRR